MADVDKYPNLTPFKKGDVNNPRGLTKEQSARRRANADKAERLRELQLDGLLKLVENMKPEQIEALVRADINTLVRDAIERQFGKPDAQLDLLSSDGSQGPTTIRLVAATSSEYDDG